MHRTWLLSQNIIIPSLQAFSWRLTCSNLKGQNWDQTACVLISKKCKVGQNFKNKHRRVDYIFMKSFPWHLNWSLENRLCVREADVISDEVFAVVRWRLMLYWKETSKRNRNITGSKTRHSWNEGCLQHDGCDDLSSQMFKINASICLYWLSLVFTDRNCVYYLHLWVEESRFGAINSNNGHHKPSWKRKKKKTTELHFAENKMHSFPHGCSSTRNNEGKQCWNVLCRS